MIENVFTFGPNGGIVGVLSEPDAATQVQGAPIVVASNVGLNHRVGPCRLYVELARSLARRGFSMLRFDLSGLGDSEPRREGANEFERARLDVADAFAFLQKKRGVQTFVKLGMCSGTDSTHTMSVRDSRIVGSVFIEGYIFRTPRFYLHRYGARPLHPRFWKQWALQKLSRYGIGAEALREAGERQEIYTREYPTREQLHRDYDVLLGRNVRLLFLFAGGPGSDYVHNYKGQFYDLFPQLKASPLVEHEFYPDADHVFSRVEDRAALVHRIGGWMEAHFRGSVNKEEPLPSPSVPPPERPTRMTTNGERKIG